MHHRIMTVTCKVSALEEIIEHLQQTEYFTERQDIIFERMDDEFGKDRKASREVYEKYIYEDVYYEFLVYISSSSQDLEKEFDDLIDTYINHE